MPNKFHRQNLRMGSNPFGRKSNLAKNSRGLWSN